MLPDATAQNEKYVITGTQLYWHEVCYKTYELLHFRKPRLTIDTVIRFFVQLLDLVVMNHSGLTSLTLRRLLSQLSNQFLEKAMRCKWSDDYPD